MRTEQQPRVSPLIPSRHGRLAPGLGRRLVVGDAHWCGGAAVLLTETRSRREKTAQMSSPIGENLDARQAPSGRVAVGGWGWVEPQIGLDRVSTTRTISV